MGAPKLWTVIRTLLGAPFTATEIALSGRLYSTALPIRLENTWPILV
jgi:hypothetical protein